MNYTFVQENIWIFILLVGWELFWKGKALWKAAKNDQGYWFIGMLLLSTIGILPILYLLFFKKINEVKKYD